MVDISTHTPLAGRDWGGGWGGNRNQDFYSHAPCGARRGVIAHHHIELVFLLTRPLRGATRRAFLLAL